MKRDIYYRGEKGAKYGIWNCVQRCWQFGICEDTPMLAEARLFQKIGDDARKWRFEARRLPAKKDDSVKERTCPHEEKSICCDCDAPVSRSLW